MVRRFLARIPPVPFAVLAGLGIAGLVLMGSLWLAGAKVRGFDLRGETNFPSAFSTTLLWLAALLALAVASTRRHRAALLALSALFAFLGIDELLVIHERLQDASGLGRVVYAPLALAGALVTVLVGRQLRSTAGVIPLLVGGAASWAASQAVDALQPHNRTSWSIVPEEFLEMAGSALFALALLLALRASMPAKPETESVGRAGVG